MPEGPETRAIADAVNTAIKWPCSVVKIISEGAEHSAVPISKFYTVGKVVVLELGDRQLLMGMGMTGTLMPGVGNGKHVRSVIMMDDVPVAFRDVRKFGTLRLSSHKSWGDGPAACLGLACPWIDRDGNTDEDAIRKSAVACTSGRAIHAVLLDQKAVVSGVGNIYASEACHLAGLDPRSPWSGLSDRQKEDVTMKAVQIMHLSLKNGGSTVRDYTAGGKDGSFQTLLKVYGREGRPCTNVKGEAGVVCRDTVGGRSVYFWKARA